MTRERDGWKRGVNNACTIGSYWGTWCVYSWQNVGRMGGGNPNTTCKNRKQDGVYGGTTRWLSFEFFHDHVSTCTPATENYFSSAVTDFTKMEEKSHGEQWRKPALLESERMKTRWTKLLGWRRTKTVRRDRNSVIWERKERLSLRKEEESREERLFGVCGG